MNLGEAEELYQILLKISEILNGISIKSTEISDELPETKEAVMTAQQFTRIAYRMNHILAHMGLPPEINKAISKLQQLVFMVRMLQMSLNFLSMTTPYGMIMGLLGLGSVAVTLGSGSILEGY